MRRVWTTYSLMASTAVLNITYALLSSPSMNCVLHKSREPALVSAPPLTYMTLLEWSVLHTWGGTWDSCTPSCNHSNNAPSSHVSGTALCGVTVRTSHPGARRAGIERRLTVPIVMTRSVNAYKAGGERKNLTSFQYRTEPSTQDGGILHITLISLSLLNAPTKDGGATRTGRLRVREQVWMGSTCMYQG